MIAVRRVFTFALLTALALAIPVASQAGGPRRWSDLNRHPQIVRYNPATDKITRQESVLTKSLVNIPGGKESYSGNRLRQFRFLGKPGRGGIYDAFGDYPKSEGGPYELKRVQLLTTHRAHMLVLSSLPPGSTRESSAAANSASCALVSA